MNLFQFLLSAVEVGILISWQHLNGEGCWFIRDDDGCMSQGQIFNLAFLIGLRVTVYVVEVLHSSFHTSQVVVDSRLQGSPCFCGFAIYINFISYRVLPRQLPTSIYQLGSGAGV